MTKLVWGDPAARRYESGVDRGVLYPTTGPGVVWNGLQSVNESFIGGDRTEYYFDGFKYFDDVSNKDFQATLQAYSAPAEFGPCVGELPVVKGFLLTRQQRSRFGLSYRTLINGGDNYKLHLIYNASATPTSRSSQTNSNTPAPSILEWKIDAVPVPSGTFKASAHYVVDSRTTTPSSLAALETLLYGTATVAPALPSISVVIGLFQT